MTVRERDHGSQELIRRFGQKAKLRVGVMGSKAAEGYGETARDEGGRFVKRMTTAEVAEQHEFGIGVPKRSFLRAWFDEQVSDLKAELTKASRVILKGRSFKKSLEDLGLVWVGDIKVRISAGIPPKLSEMAIKLRKDRGNTDDTPLIDTGQLWSSIVHLVEIR